MSKKVERPLSERILETAEEVLRKYGVQKTNVVDIAQALGMSHGNIYRHFPSKQALLTAVAVSWLHKVSEPLDRIVQDRSRPASKRLVKWFDTLRAAKRRKVLDDPELFRTHQLIVAQAPEVVKDHIRLIHRQVEQIIADGVTSAEFSRKIDPKSTARAFLLATAPFHHPALLTLADPPSNADARALLNLLLASLKAGRGG